MRENIITDMESRNLMCSCFLSFKKKSNYNVI